MSRDTSGVHDVPSVSMVMKAMRLVLKHHFTNVKTACYYYVAEAVPDEHTDPVKSHQHCSTSHTTIIPKTRHAPQNVPWKHIEQAAESAVIPHYDAHLSLYGLNGMHGGIFMASEGRDEEGVVEA
jgi:hypothetical protein